MRAGNLLFLALAVVCVAAQTESPPLVLTPPTTNVTIETPSLCDTPPFGMVGAYSPADVAGVPPEVVEAVAFAFLDNPNVTYDGELFSCDSNVTALAMDACSQVVAGTNWMVRVGVVCMSGFSNGAAAADVVATVFQPLPYTQDPPQVNQLTLTAIIQPPTPLGEQFCNADVDPDAPAYAPVATDELPADVAGLYMSAMATVVASTPCSPAVLQTLQSCVQEAEGGSNYEFTIEATCEDGTNAGQLNLMISQPEGEPATVTSATGAGLGAPTGPSQPGPQVLPTGPDNTADPTKPQVLPPGPGSNTADPTKPQVLPPGPTADPTQPQVLPTGPTQTGPQVDPMGPQT